MSSQRNIILNSILLAISLFVFSFLVTAIDVIRFAAFSIFFVLIGLSMQIIVKKFLEKDLIANVCVSFVFGAVAYVISYIILNLIGVSSILPILAILFVISVMGNRIFVKKDLSFMGHSGIFATRTFSILILFFILGLFLLSDSILFVQDGVYIKDPLHNTYEVSISRATYNFQSLQDPAYLGKEIKYHFGVPVLMNQAHEVFGLDLLLLSYWILPAILLFLFIILVYRLSFSVSKNNRAGLAATFFALFGALTIIPFSLVLGLNQNLFNIVTSMNSFGFGIILIVVFFLLIINKKKYTDFLFYDHLILLGLALVKSTFFVPLFLAILTLSIISFLKMRSFSVSGYYLSLLVPGAIYIFFFVAGAHTQNLWVIYPGFIGKNLLSPYIIPVVSFIVSVFLLFGIATLFVFKRIRTFFSLILSKNYFKSSQTYRSFLFGAVIFFSFLLSIFLYEVTEFNQMQFVYPGLVLILVLFTTGIYNKISSRKGFAVLAILLIVSSTATISLTKFSAFNSFDPLSDDINPLSSAKIAVTSAFTEIISTNEIQNLGKFRPIPSQSCKTVLLGWGYFPSELFAGLDFLEKTDGIFLFGKHYEQRIDDCATSWSPNGFIRTALSGRQTVVENYKYRSILMQPTYFNRTLDTIAFYYFGSEKNDLSTQNWKKIFNITASHKINFLDYFSVYEKPNFFSRDLEFRQFMEDRLPMIKNKSDQEKRTFIQNFLDAHDIKFIMFELGEKPNKLLMDTADLSLVFEEESVRIYKLN